MTLFTNHIPEETLLLCSTGELSRYEKRRVLDHLGACSACAMRLREVSTLHKDLRELHDSGRVPDPGESIASSSWFEKPPAKLWIRMTALLVACSLTATLVLFGNGFVVEAHVRSTLERASAAERRDQTHPRTYRITASGQSCTLGGTRRAAETGSSCSRADQALASAHWNSKNPLSAGSFAAWRSSLKSHHDTIQSDTSSVTVRTESSTGPLKAATLQMSSTNFLPIEAKLEFTNITFQIQAVEGEALQPTIETRDEAPSGPVVKQPSIIDSVPDPRDVAESEAWAVLHRIGADGGWEATVRRHADGVEVLGVVSDDARRTQLIEGLRSIDGIRTEVATYADAGPQLQAILPVRLSRGAGKPLAHVWLDQQFPEDEERSKFRNDIRETSRLILGRTVELEDLKKSFARTQSCESCRRGLADLIRKNQSALDADLLKLGTAIQPYVGGTPRRSGTLTYAEAQKLDQALGELFAGAPEADADADSDRVRVRSLLFR